MVEKMLATFKIDPAQWKEFKDRCTESDSNATKTILNLIGAYLDGRVSLAPNRPESDITLIDERLDSAIAPLRLEVDALKAEMESLHLRMANQPSTIQNQPSEDAPQGIPIKTPVRSDVPICSKCGSSDIARWGKGRLRSDGSQGRRVLCGGCGKISTIG